MRRGIALFFGGLILGLTLYHLSLPIFLPPAISAVFSPEDWEDIITLMDSAKDTMDIEIYVLSSRDVVEALERARARGVDVRIIIERNTMGDGNQEISNELASKGFNIRYASSEFKLTHSKFMIIDGKAVLVGSHNLSNSALKLNREASVIIRDEQTVREFMEVFEYDWSIAY